MASLSSLPRKPEARTQKVEDLVERVLRGLVRVPRFQRGLRWESLDVERLFDSIYRGYPIGSLLFYKQPVLEGLPVLRSVLSFLRSDAGIPHLRLLPKSILLDVLARFFGRHEEAGARSRILLTRWFWHAVFGAAWRHSDRPSVNYLLREAGVAV